MSKRFTSRDAERVSGRVRGARSLIVEHNITLASIGRGMTVELEHGSKFGRVTNVTHDDEVATFKIALAHLIEDSDYYEKLKIVENPMSAVDRYRIARKRCAFCWYSNGRHAKWCKRPR